MSELSETAKDILLFPLRLQVAVIRGIGRMALEEWRQRTGQ